LPTGLGGNPSANRPAADVAWKKSAPTPSTAMSADQWNILDKGQVRIQKTNFQEPLPQIVDIAPIPEVMLKEQPQMVAAPHLGHKHAGKYTAQSAMPIPSAPNEYARVSLPTYTLRPPDVLLIESQKGLLTQPVRGQHLVRVDGTVGIGIYGPALVAGMTIQEAREAIARVIHSRLDDKTIEFKDVLNGLSVDVLAYNSSVYYIITDGAGLGEQVYRFPVTGSETVLDAISNINGLPLVASPRRIWVARRNTAPGPESVLPVDWKGITQLGAMNTNWQIMPGDRVYVQADPMRRFNNNLSKMLEPIERVFGATLLGSQMTNSIRNGTVGFGGR
jgi:polysaccharide export outer membrane protein